MLKNKKIYIVTIAAVTATALINGCSKEEDSASGVALDMPQVTQAVSGASLYSAIHPKATTGLSLNSQSCTSCGNGNGLSTVWGLASAFIMQGKMADANSCIIKAMSKANVIPGLTSGEYKYMYSSDSKSKVKITSDGTTVSSFEIFSCDSSAQTQYMSGTNSGGTVTFNIRIAPQSGMFVKMSATGTMSGADWTSKSLTMGYSLSNSNYSEFTITQQSDYLDITGVVDTGTLGTIDGTDIQFASRAQLIGNSVKTYALGDGSVKFAVGGAGATATNWNGDTGTVGSGPTTYDGAVASATMPSAPTTRTTAFETSEQWDCTTPSDATNIETVASSNTGLMTDVQACIADFQ